MIYNITYDLLWFSKPRIRKCGYVDRGTPLWRLVFISLYLYIKSKRIPQPSIGVELDSFARRISTFEVQTLVDKENTSGKHDNSYERSDGSYLYSYIGIVTTVANTRRKILWNLLNITDIYYVKIIYYSISSIVL